MSGVVEADGEELRRPRHWRDDLDAVERDAQRLSADIIDFSEKGSSVSKGETLIDTARTIEAMGIDVIVIRHPAAGSAEPARVRR